MKTFSNEIRRVVGRGAQAVAVIAAGVLAALAPLLISARAFADEYEPVTGTTARAATDPNPFVIGAYGFIWVAVVIYVVGVARGLAKAKAEIAELQQRVTTGGLKR
ncbi:MAG TPA: hypothetical protein VGG33_05045 [Polyangia bacterium]